MRHGLLVVVMAACGGLAGCVTSEWRHPRTGETATCGPLPVLEGVTTMERAGFYRVR